MHSAVSRDMTQTPVVYVFQAGALVTSLLTDTNPLRQIKVSVGRVSDIC